MIPLLVLVLLPLDISIADTATAGAGGLRIEAMAVGRRVGARLVNTGKAPVDVMLGYTCGGPEPFTAIVDGAERSFVTGSVVCSGNAMIIERIAPGGRREVRSETLILDGERHRLAVRYRYPRAEINPKVWNGDITSAAISLEAAQLALDLRAGAVGKGGAVAFTMEHRWRGAARLRFLAEWTGACARPQDEFIVDGEPHATVETACAGPSASLVRAVAPGESFTTSVTLHLPRGRHKIRARYRVAADDWRTVGSKGNIGDWTGDVESPEIEVSVR